MGKIRKQPSPHSDITLSPALKRFIEACTTLPLHQLPSHLGSFPAQWPFPRGDLFNWTSALNRFDDVLEKFANTYGLHEGPQCQAFSRKLLLEPPENGPPIESATLDQEGFTAEGDREVVEHILDFSRLLFENCANRRLYASSHHLNALINTTSTSLLNVALRLALRLAQKYSYDRIRQTSGREGLFLTSLSQNTLAAHYQIGLDKLHKLSLPFRNGLASPSKRASDIKETDQGLHVTPTYVSDILELLQDKEPEHKRFEAYGQPYFSLRVDHRQEGDGPNPSTGADGRSTSGDNGVNGDLSEPKNSAAHFELIEVSTSELLQKPLHEVVAEYMPKFPQECKYEFLCRLRVSKALCGSTSERVSILQSRLLAVANYLNIFPESQHHHDQKIFQPEGDEARRSKLSTQLCELLHPPGKSQQVPRPLQSLALTVLEGYLNHQKKSAEVIAALGANVSHGVLTYVVRKAVNDLSEDREHTTQEERDWSRALFSILHTLPRSAPRAADGLLSTGVLQSFVDALRLRSAKAETSFSQILTTIDVFLFNIRDAFNVVVQAGGPDVLSELLQHEIRNGFTTAIQGEGVPQEWRSDALDYRVGFIQQGVIRSIFKLLRNLIGVSSGGFDRQLRNLIESPQLLGSLRNVIDYPSFFGSNIWCGAVEIFSNFIHNEPTSYAAVAEAGLTKAFLGTVLGLEGSKSIPNGLTEHSPSSKGTVETQSPPATLEAISSIPLAFSAICLNENGMRDFNQSEALQKYFQMLFKPAYCKALIESVTEHRTRRTHVQGLGNAFDELARHHPQLKPQIISNFMKMLDALHQDVINPEHQRRNGLAEPSKHKDALSVFMLTPLVSSSTNGNDVQMAEVNAGAAEDEVKWGSSQVNLDRMRVVSEMFSGFFMNHTFCAPFAEQGGVQKLIDVLTAPVYDLDTPISVTQSGFVEVVKTFITQKPHLTIPLLLDRLKLAAEICESLAIKNDGRPFLTSYLKREDNSNMSDSSETVCLNAMSSLRNILSVLVPTLLEPAGRHSQHPMSSINVADILSSLVGQLASVSRLCILENTFLQNQVPAQFADGNAAGGSALDVVQRSESQRAADVPLSTNQAPSPSNAGTAADVEGSNLAKVDPKVAEKQKQLYLKIGALLKNLPYDVAYFMHSIGKCLAMTRRLPSDSFQRAKYLSTAASIATALVGLLESPIPANFSTRMVDYARRNMLVATLAAISDKRSEPTSQFLTIVVWCFKKAGGVDVLAKIANTFFSHCQTSDETQPDGKAQGAVWACQGLRTLLGFFIRATNVRSVHESHQTAALTARADRERDRNDYFSEGQFLVEMRCHALTLIQPIWESDGIAKLPRDLVKHVCTVMQFSLEGSGEATAFRRSDKMPSRSASPAKKWRPRSEETVKSLTDKGFATDLAKEALYRCMGHLAPAQEYCNLHSHSSALPRFSIPLEDLPTTTSDTEQQREAGASRAEETPPEQTEQEEEEDAARTAAQEFVSRLLESSEDQTIAETPSDEHDQPGNTSTSGDMDLSGQTTAVATGLPSDSQQSAGEIAQVTIDDLDDMRDSLRAKLVDRCVHVLYSFDSLSFELADLITSSVLKNPDEKAAKTDISRTLLHSLISYQGHDDLKEVSTRIASSAHLLGVILQDNVFFASAREDLAENVDVLAQFLAVPKDAQGSQTFTWMSNILLIIEKILCEDLHPRMLDWTAADAEKEQSGPVVVYKTQSVSKQSREEVFNIVLDLLPKVGKDTVLGTSCLRVLMALTKDPSTATRLSEKRNMQRLFVMVKQLATVKEAKVMSLLLVILRQITEDAATLKKTMHREIESYFVKNSRQAPSINTYTRQLFHLSLRSPEVFVEATNELVALSPRVQITDVSGEHSLVMKRDLPPIERPDESVAEAKDESGHNLPEVDAALETSTAHPTTEPAGSNEDLATADSKAPHVSRADGVTSFLLSELLAYKDVQGNEPPAKPSDNMTVDKQGDVEMTNGDSSVSSQPNQTNNGSASGTSPDWTAFKVEDHPIFMYRCMLLQCLTELLQSYDIVKLNFLAFSRKAEPITAGPLKPRSGILNYLLQNTIADAPTLNTADPSVRRRAATCNWAMNVLTALCARSQEKLGVLPPDSTELDEDPDLAFIRKFVIEHACKAYKDSLASADVPKEGKFARLHNLAELFNRMLTGQPASDPLRHDHSRENRGGVSKSLVKIMFDKHFIPMLTTSVSDLDQHTPDAHKALKCILKTLKTLTHATIHLSETGKITGPAEPGDEDEISSASSHSDMDEGREETPNLFRNSTLGMFEPGRANESSSEESESEDGDDDMYGDDYADDMEFDEADPDRPDGEVVSDDDEEGPASMGEVEGVSGDVPMEVEIDIDEEPEDADSHEDPEDPSESSASGEDEDTDGDDVEVMEDIHDEEDYESLADEDGGEDDESQDEDDGAIEIVEPDLPDVMEPTLRSGAESPSEQESDMPIDHSHGHGPFEAFDEHLHVGDIHEDAEEPDSEEDDHDNEDDEDDYDEDEMAFGHNELDDDEEAEFPASRLWHYGGSRRHHQMHHPRHMHSLFTEMDSLALPDFRSHRAGGPRTPDDTQGINPLLNRTRREQVQPPSIFSRGPRGAPHSALNHAASLFASLERQLPEDVLGFDRHALEHILQSFNQGGAFSISMRGTDGRGHPVHGSRHIFEGGSFRPGPTSSADREDPFTNTAFEPAPTKQRWEDAARILYGPDFVLQSGNLVNSILKVLTPPALEREKQLKVRLEREEHAAEEKRAKEKALREEQEARQKQERAEQEAREVAEREAAEAEAARLAEENFSENDEAEGDTTQAMEGVEQDLSTAVAEAQTAESSHPPEGAESAAPAEPVVTSIRGREVNITHLGIDTAYLDALPEELREEVIMQQAAEQRSTQPAPQEGQEPSTIDSEFLDALPADIRDEILQQEAADRRRREREEARRQARESGAPAQPEEIDPASLIASLDPSLRQQVLMESDEDMLAALPPEIQAEARALGGHRRRGAVPPPTLLGRAAGLMNPFGPGGVARDLGSQSRHEGEKRQRTPIVQMLDKAGIAGLLRLMLLAVNVQSFTTLNSVLLNVCGNRQTRSEVINGLLSILQDGSADVNAIERCYSQLTLKAKQQGIPKTPAKKSTSGPGIHCETPRAVIDHTLSALNLLASSIGHIPHFFITEHDVVGTAKSKSARKGKAKDNRANRYPFMVLVGLLDREAVMNSSMNLEQLSGLLAQITQPLNNIGKKDKLEKSSDEKPTDLADHAVSDTTHQQDGAFSANIAQEAPGTASAGDVVTDEGPGADQPNGEGESSRLNEESKAAKKARNLSPPDVPAELLKPVVNLTMSRECNSKVFQNAIATMNSLAVVEGARDVFKQELVEQARSLAQTIQLRLASLVEPMKKAENEVDAQSLALAELSPTGSDQTKFHRVLTALDYLYHSDAKNKKGEQKEDEAKTAHGTDGLMRLYEESSFLSLWHRLSDVLNAIKRSDSHFFLDVATILLSLIESLMLVCKRIKLTDGVTMTRRQTGEATESKDMQSIFFSFTNNHRKILNELVRHNPKLMSNNFSVLIKNPGILEFDNKRSYFSRRLHHRSGDMRHYPHPSLQIHVRRDQVFLDSYKHLHYKNAQEVKYGKLNVRFHNEEGVDAGGVTREWFQVLARQMFNPDYALFNPVASDRTTFHPNTLSWVNPEHLSFFKFIGRIIGKALYENRVLDCHFSRAVYKKILGEPVSIKDMETVDLDYSKNMEWMLSNDITDIITETFSTTVDKFGDEEVVDLIPNGRNIPVTEENKEEYVRKVIEYRLTGSVNEQLEHFLQGFYDIVPTELISIFDEGELELLISGMPDVDVEDWRANTDYVNYNASSSQIQWFWRAVRSFDKEERARLLQFVTGAGKVPLNGFKELEGMNGFTRFSIHKDYGSHDRLPSSHTCFNQLDLPEYDSYEQLRRSLYTAMTTGNEHFGFA
ncbi:MAG: hypothetical protein Q9162_000571 [Coniocarpon cinnabarinum]